MVSNVKSAARETQKIIFVNLETMYSDSQRWPDFLKHLKIVFQSEDLTTMAGLARVRSRTLNLVENTFGRDNNFEEVRRSILRLLGTRGLQKHISEQTQRTQVKGNWNNESYAIANG